MIEYYMQTAFPGELTLLRDYVVERALPPLDDLQGKADALEQTYADFERLDSFDEPGGTAETAAAVAAEKYFNQGMSLRHALLGLFTLGLHHLVEQQLGRMHPADEREPRPIRSARAVRCHRGRRHSTTELRVVVDPNRTSLCGQRCQTRGRRRSGQASQGATRSSPAPRHQGAAPRTLAARAGGSKAARWR